jgi:hypothetical protein
MIVPSQLELKTHTNFGCAASLATLVKLVDRFPLPPVTPPISDTSLTHLTRLAAHSTMSPRPIAMGQSFMMTLYFVLHKYLIRFRKLKSNYDYMDCISKKVDKHKYRKSILQIKVIVHFNYFWNFRVFSG